MIAGCGQPQRAALGRSEGAFGMARAMWMRPAGFGSALRVCSLCLTKSSCTDATIPSASIQNTSRLARKAIMSRTCGRRVAPTSKRSDQALPRGGQLLQATQTAASVVKSTGVMARACQVNLTVTPRYPMRQSGRYAHSQAQCRSARLPSNTAYIRPLFGESLIARVGRMWSNATPALALCAAALRAKESSDGE
ncbi:hypothetical protein UFOVP5_23 [uncultured Caudovirales phage]|uniref:Uncharacterized protein n=1 Tax=uncultured Caudovirales phage TaxID=2100421 RepID=A0A6J5KHV8_9CAUD|nr:hypothetical protein UFOVP5_23 [uncultured Caudovirales phage]